MKFGDAIKALQQGKMIQRTGWNGKGMFVFMQVPAKVPAEVIPNMTSLPMEVKEEFEKRCADPNNSIRGIYYTDQLAIVTSNNIVTGWSPSIVDCMANDWDLYGETITS